MANQSGNRGSLPFSSGATADFTGSPYPLRVGSGEVLPLRFDPPNPQDTPDMLFSPTNVATESPLGALFVRRTYSKQFLIYTDGVCLEGKSQSARAGCAFVFRNAEKSPPRHGHVSFRIERKGPTGRKNIVTANRAELRAVIAALRFRNWAATGCTSLVIAASSEYVVKGITDWARTWVSNGWKNQQGTEVNNKDLWQCLLGELESHWYSSGLRVQFWFVPKRNNPANPKAREAATLSERQNPSDNP